VLLTSADMVSARWREKSFGREDNGIYRRIRLMKLVEGGEEKTPGHPVSGLRKKKMTEGMDILRSPKKHQ
jgi:hypothetical protein